ncbi:MAG: ChbG/HpnK family deacetylase [Bdellovibrionales bacterium]|nr:ChbG/HpnK family deacetylase [Ramlibacter sp.]
MCLCVDDFGLHPGINSAALHLVAVGKVHAVGCMTGGPAWKAGSRLLRAIPPEELDAGLHLDFTETPLKGKAASLPGLIVTSALGRLDRRAVRAEIRAQFRAFEQAMGRPPAFIDGHQHVHQFAGIRDELLDLLDKRKMNPAPWLRATRAPLEGAQAGWLQSLKSRFIESLGADSLAVQARSRGYRQNAHLLGVYDFRGGPIRYLERMAAWLACAEQGDLLMCHPSESTSTTDPIAMARQDEFKVLCSKDFDALLGASDINLMPLSQIL